ncbi:MAG: hypothetical protein JJT82_10920, partial [Legionellaceae bacterium]|nr:hypothetical protein [Legionellaceae bacterium]
EALKQNTPLTTLHLGLNFIGDDGAVKIAEALKKNTTLTTLHLGLTNIGDAGTKKIAEALKQNTALTEIHLGWNNIGYDGAVKIAEALKKNTTLTTLHLDSSNIGDAGTKKIAEALKQNTALTEIHLGSNNIGATGAKKIAEALKKNTTLTTLHLGSNNIGATGAKKIAEALKKNTTLTTIDLGSNHIGNDGAVKIAEALKKNTTLTTIDLGSNHIGNDGAVKIAEALKKNTTLTEIHLGVNNIGDAGAEKIASLLKRNKAIKKSSELLLQAIENTGHRDTTGICDEEAYAEQIQKESQQIEKQISTLKEWHDHSVQLKRVTEAWILKRIKLFQIKEMLPKLQALLPDAKELVCEVSQNFKNNETGHYSPKFLEEIILHYYGQKNKTAEDFENIINFYLSLPLNDDDLEPIFIHSAVAYFLPEDKNPWFGASRTTLFDTLNHTHINSKFNGNQQKLFGHIQRKFSLDQNNPEDTTGSLTTFSLFSTKEAQETQKAEHEHKPALGPAMLFL